MINHDGLNQYASCLCPLRETSIGGENGLALTDINVEAYNFDKLMEEYIKKNGIRNTSQKESCDALYIAVGSKQEICLIEFRSGKISKDLNNLKSKAYSSLLVLTDILNTTISTTRISVSLFLVYDKEINPDNEKVANARAVALRTNNRFVRFGLRKFEGLYFKEVHTIDKNEFDDYFKEHWMKDIE